jgi:hypothetical protein
MNNNVSEITPRNEWILTFILGEERNKKIILLSKFDEKGKLIFKNLGRKYRQLKKEYKKNPVFFLLKTIEGENGLLAVQCIPTKQFVLRCVQIKSQGIF